MSGQIGVARGLIGLLYKEETASDAAVGLDNIVYRGDEVIKTAILSELSTRPLPAESRTPGLDLLLRRLRVFAVERLKLLGGESLKPPHERRAAAQTLGSALSGARARLPVPPLEGAAGGSGRLDAPRGREAEPLGAQPTVAGARAPAF